MSDAPTLGSRFADELPEMAAPWQAAEPPAPRLLVLNEPLAAELGLDAGWLRSDDGVRFLTGTALPEGAKPVAQAYAGHQFGGYSPRLGDGRALLLGEIGDRDLHLKGSGRTPFARGGDGLAAVGPMLREFVVSEAMHALGIPTTRSLAVIATGKSIVRENLAPGAILVRVAASHLRVGSFQFARATGDEALLRRLAEHARLHPDREVLLKLRSKPGEHTTHIEELPYQKLTQRLDGGLPDNLRLVYGHMGEVLDRTDLLVTVSSTAALEALHRRIPTAILTDLGVREALGNHHFIGSRCLASWDQLDAGHRPEPDEAWVARQGVATDGAFDAARERIAELLALPLPPLTPYYTPATAPGYLPAVLARHHLAPDGSPLPGAPATGRAPGPVRQIVRRAARGAYRHGVQRVAPVIRRMGEL